MADKESYHGSETTQYDGRDNAVETDNSVEKDNSWGMKPKIVELRDRDQRSGFPARELGVTWKNLTVKAISADAAIHENFASQFNIPKLVRESKHKPPLKTILDNSHGCVKPGEMLLVLGRPGT
jgi:hypothetical protein